MVASVRKLQHRGLAVQGGFIVGFDNDPPDIFGRQIRFIQNSGIVEAMVGLLNAPKGTRLYRRLKVEGRILWDKISGNNMDLSLNFVPKMPRHLLLKGYRDILATIYAPREYYKRVKTFLREFCPSGRTHFRISGREVLAFLRSLWRLGLQERGRRYYWKLLFWTLARRPQLFPWAVTLSIYGFHFRKVLEGRVLNGF